MIRYTLLAFIFGIILDISSFSKSFDIFGSKMKGLIDTAFVWSVPGFGHLPHNMK